MELRFSNEQEIYNNVKESILLALTHRELIPEINLEKTKKEEPLKVEYNKKEPDTVVNYEKAVEKQPETVNEIEHVIVRKVPEVKNLWFRQECLSLLRQKEQLYMKKL